MAKDTRSQKAQAIAEGLLTGNCVRSEAPCAVLLAV